MPAILCVGCQPFWDFHPVGHDGGGGGIQIIDHLVHWLNRSVTFLDAGRTKRVESRKTEETISGTEVTEICPAVLPNVTSCIVGFMKENKLKMLCDKDRESWDIKRTLLSWHFAKVHCGSMKRQEPRLRFLLWVLDTVREETVTRKNFNIILVSNQRDAAFVLLGLLSRYMFRMRFASAVRVQHTKL